MNGFNLISAAERQALLDAIRRRSASQLSEDEVADFVRRVEAAQTHAGLDAIRHELPPERPPPPVAPPPPPPQRSPWLLPPAPPAPARDPAAKTALLVFIGVLVLVVIWVSANDGNDDPTTELPTTTVFPRPEPTVPP